MNARSRLRQEGPRSSRLFVKGLPKHLKEVRLRELFGAKGGRVTDCKILKTAEGKSRQV